MQGSPRKFATLSGTAICILLFLHIVLAVVISVEPNASKGSRVLKFYRRFVALGPFFQEQRIVESPHTWVSFHENGVWTDGVELNGHALHERSPHYAATQYRTFENYLGQLSARASQRKRRMGVIKELERYFRLRTDGTRADSLNVIYVRQGKAKGVAYTDTVYQHKFRR